MAIIYDFKKKLAIDFGELIGKAVSVSDLVFDEPMAAPVATGRSTMVKITHTASGEARTIVYNRTSFATIFENLTPGRLVFSSEETIGTTHELIGKFSEAYGVPIAPEDVLDITLNNGSYQLTITADPKSLAYEGKFTILLYNGGTDGGLPPPVNDFRFKGDAKNGGTSGLDMTIPFIYTESHGRTWAHVPAGGPMLFGNDCKIKLCGDYTLDFEILFDQNYSGYLYTFTNNPSGTGSSNTQGTLAFYARKFYEYLVTPTSGGSEWAAGKTEIPWGEPVRITMRARNGYTSFWVNGVMRANYAGMPASANLFLTAFRNVDGGAAQMPQGIGIANLRSWDLGLDNAQLDVLFGKPKDTLKPRNSWSLGGNNYDLGREAYPWLAPMSYSTFGDKTWAASNAAAGSAIGTFLDASRDFTLQFKIFNPTGSFADVEGMFGTASLTDVNAVLKLCIGNFYLGGSTEPFSTRMKLISREQRTITLRRTGDLYEAWVDEFYLGTCSVPAHSTQWTHFGKVGQALGTAWYFSDIKFWDRSLTIPELRSLVGPNIQQLTLVSGLANRSGDAALIDGSTGSVFNATYNPTAIGSLGAVHADKWICGLQYYFVNDSTNWAKKVKEIYLDKWQNGAWVAKQGQYTHAARQGFPSRECIIYDNPTPVDPLDLRVRLRGVSHWGDQFNYRWVSEFMLMVGEKPALIGPWPSGENAMTNVTGDTTLLDGNNINGWTQYAAAREGVVEATLPASFVGLSLQRLDIRFMTDAANWDKKAKWICVDVWENDAWVEKAKVTTKPSGLNAPQNESIVLATPVVFQNQKMRLRCSGNNGNTSNIVSLVDINPMFGSVATTLKGK